MSNNENNKYSKIICEYIYAINNSIYQKTKTIYIINDKFNIPITKVYYTEKKEIELFLKPRLIYNDPFRVKGSVIALCDTFDKYGNPYKENININ